MVGFLGGWVGGVYNMNTWIDEAPKPALWPATWVFPVFWAFVNYPSLGLASWYVWKRRHEAAVGGALRLFAAQLVLNASFLPIVYRARSRSLYVILDAFGLALTMVTTLSY